MVGEVVALFLGSEHVGWRQLERRTKEAKEAGKAAVSCDVAADVLSETKAQPTRAFNRVMGEHVMSTGWIILLVVLAIVVFGGGGGYYWSRGRR